MYRILFILFLLTIPCYAGNISDPIAIRDEKDMKLLNQELKTIYDNQNNLKVVTSDPNGVTTGNYGDLLIYSNSGTFNTVINVTSPSGSSWSNSLSSSIVGTQYKVGSFTRDMTLGSGTVAYTGVGFKPKAITFLFFWIGNSQGVGVDDGTTSGVISNFGGTNYTGTTSNSIDIINSLNSSSQVAYINSFDPDGFHLSWILTGSNTAGTASIFYKADR